MREKSNSRLKEKAIGLQSIENLKFFTSIAKTTHKIFRLATARKRRRANPSELGFPSFSIRRHPKFGIFVS